MDDLLRSGIGGEKGDQTIRATSADRPLWTLTPLPLTQVNPTVARQRSYRGPIKSLQSSCLASISRNYHLYTPESFQGIPPALLCKIFGRIQHDRSYDISSLTPCLRPDETTLWIFNLLCDPDSTPSSHTLALPADITLKHFAPHPTFANPLHPFIQLPTLYRSLQSTSGIQLMTTLHLDGVDDLVTDQTVTALKWAEHLTVLRMTGCERVTDAGIRLLASSLELPGKSGGQGRGMWRLRAWYLDGCAMVGDRSMVSFGRWPGLVLLDLRNTSCTSSSINILNRNVETLYSGRLALLQPCSSGLRPLFARHSASSDLVDRLAQTLLLPNTHMRQSLNYRSLSLIPSYTLPPAQYLPDPTPLSSNITKYDLPGSTSIYRSGLGQLYGSGVKEITDEARAFRRDVSKALYMQALEEGLVKEEKREKRWPFKKDKKDQKDGSNWAKHAAGNTYKLKKGEEDDRSKRFITAGANGQAKKEDKVEGDEGLMLVRVAQEGWEGMEWTLGAAHVAATAIQASQRVKPKVNLIEELLGFTQPTATTAPVNSKTATPNTNLFKPKARSSQPFSAYSSVQPSPSAVSAPSLPHPRSSNPFSTSSQGSNGFGVKPLSGFTAPKSHPDLEGFSSTGQKRSWGGGSENEAKRTGMKMFSGTKL